MRAKHTPGPWIIQESDFCNAEFVITTDQREDDSITPICEMDIHFDGQIGAEQKANALLIAAAPDLLMALQLIIDFDDAGMMLTANNITQARAAIAKAIG